MYNLRNRNFIKELDFTPTEFRHLLDIAQALKTAKYAGTEMKRLEGTEIALLFEKTSTRTRAAFEVAAFDQGAHVTYLDPSGSQLGHKESIADTARVLGRMFDAIEFRGSTHSDIETLAEYAGVPVYNGLTNDWHPTQMLADMLTMREHARRDWSDISFAFLGDCRYNMARSLLITGAMLGCDVRLVGPESLWPPADVIDHAQTISKQTDARITLTDDPDAGVADVDFIHTDVWVSMGEPKDVWDERASILRPFQVNAAAMKRTGNLHTKFMHCLPAFHDMNTVVGRQMAKHLDMADGIEVTNDVFESPASIVFDQAENRLHTIKAVLVATLA